MKKQAKVQDVTTQELLVVAFEAGEVSASADSTFLQSIINPTMSKEAAMIALKKELNILWPALKFRPSDKKGFVQEMVKEYRCFDRLRKNPIFETLESEKGKAPKKLDPAKDFETLCKKYDEAGELEKLFEVIRKVVC